MLREQNVLEKLESEVKEKKDEARRKLQQDLITKKGSLEYLKLAHKAETFSLVKKIGELQGSLKVIQTKQELDVGKAEREISDIQKQLDSLAGLGLSNSLQRDFECTVCYEVMGPPRQIFQCVNGHLIWNICKNKRIQLCPSCRINVANSQWTRNIPMERLVRDHVVGSV